MEILACYRFASVQECLILDYGGISDGSEWVLEYFIVLERLESFLLGFSEELGEAVFGIVVRYFHSEINNKYINRYILVYNIDIKYEINKHIHTSI